MSILCMTAGRPSVSRTLFKALTWLLLTVVISSLVACGGPARYPNTPEGVVRKLFDSLQEADADKYLDAIAPEDRKQPGFFFYAQLVQGFAALLGLGSVDAAKPKVGFKDLQIQALDNDGRVAHVRVTGKIRDLNLAIEDDLDITMATVNIEGTWLCALTPESRASVVTPPSWLTEEQKEAWKFDKQSILERRKILTQYPYLKPPRGTEGQRLWEAQYGITFEDLEAMRGMSVEEAEAYLYQLLIERPCDRIGITTYWEVMPCVSSSRFHGRMMKRPCFISTKQGETLSCVPGCKPSGSCGKATPWGG